MSLCLKVLVISASQDHRPSPSLIGVRDLAQIGSSTKFIVGQTIPQQPILIVLESLDVV